MQRWWTDPDLLHRFVTDSLAAELARARPGHAVPPLPWAAETSLDEDGIGVDSLERLRLATALGEATNFARSGLDESLLTRRTVGEWVAIVRRGLDAYSEQVTFRTSGTSGEPKWSVHQLTSLCAEIDVLARMFRASKRVYSTVPSHHIYGFLFTILLPAQLGVPVIDVRGRLPAGVGSILQAGDLLVGHPDFWSAFVRGTPPLAAGVTGVSSTAPCPADVGLAVRAAGIERLVEVYGSSETAGIGTRDDPAQPFELLPYWRRGADPDSLVRRLSDGSEATFTIPDVPEWTAERRLRPAARRDGAVQVAGHNVSPEHVRSVLAAHVTVWQAGVRLMRRDEGDRLKAFIVPRDPHVDRAALRSELSAWMQARLSAAEQPRSITFGEALPTGPTGKSADWQIDER